RVIVRTGTSGKISLYSSTGPLDIVVDISGYFTDSTASGKAFTPMSPVRIADTRDSGQTLGTGGGLTLQIDGLTSVPSTATAVITNITVTNTTAPSFLVTYPASQARPLASDLNWAAGQTVANLTAATIGSSGSVALYNSVGSSDVVVDLVGYFN